MFKILVAEDDAELRQLFCRVLTRHGFQPIGAADGVEALQVLERDYIDLIVSDIMMPQLDGYALVRGLRDSGNTIPVLMITARDGFQDMQFGFLAGADDYLVKPFGTSELLARIRTAIRHTRTSLSNPEIAQSGRFTTGDLVIDYDKHQTVLPQKEFLLLYKLVSSPGHIFTRQQLMDDIWGIDTHTDPRTVDVHINRLRDRFRENQDFEIITVRGIGYKAERKHEEG